MSKQKARHIPPSQIKAARLAVEAYMQHRSGDLEFRDLRILCDATRQAEAEIERLRHLVRDKADEAQDQLSENVVVEDVVNEVEDVVNELMRYIRRRVQQDMAAIVVHVRQDKEAAHDAEIERLRKALLAMPDRPTGMSDSDYTDWLTGADGTKKQPYPQRRNRQCAIGYHDECSDPEGESCGCPCHASLEGNLKGAGDD